MKRIALLAGIGAVVLTGGVAVAAIHPSEAPVLARADEPVTEEATTTSTAPDTTIPFVDTTITLPPSPETTITVPVPPTTDTTVPPAPPETTVPPQTTVPPETTTTLAPTTTTTTGVRYATPAIHLECADGDDAVVCEWEDLPEGTAQQVMMRETQGPSQELDRTDDTSVRRYVDDTADVGVSYAYRVSAYASDGRFLGTSNSVRLTHGDAGGGPDS